MMSRTMANGRIMPWSSKAASLSPKTVERGCPDEILVDRCIAGNRDAFDLLVRKYYGRAMATALRYTRNPSSASDVVSLAFVKAYVAMPGFRRQSRFWTWLHRIVMTTAFDANENLERMEFVSLDAAPMLPVADRYGRIAADPRQDFAASPRNALRDEILFAFEHLPEHEKDLLRIRYDLETPYEAMAKGLGVALGTVKSRLNRARRHLRGRMPAE